MGILQCIVCKATAEAKTKDQALEKIDHGAPSKKCNGKDENCQWFPQGIPRPTEDQDIDPHRAIEGVKATKGKSKSKPKKSSSKKK